MAISKIASAGVATDTLEAGDIAANAVGASEIAAGAVSGDKIGYLGDGSGDLTGTVSSQQLHLADAFTLTGDLTVNDDLVLGKLRDDGTGQTLTHTAATNRTLTGTGTLTMGSSIEGEPKNRTNERATSFGDITAPSLVLTPSSAPAETKGAMYYDSTEDVVLIYNGTSWDQLSNVFSATGGTTTDYTGYKVHSFTTSGTFTPTLAGTVDYLIVGGGGGGGKKGGGGGAGGFLTGTGFNVTSQVYTITVGAYGAGSSSLSARGGNGGDSSALGFTATGGGGGGSDAASYQSGSNGGSGGGTAGGGYSPAVAAGTGVSGQGNAGGVNIPSSPYVGGGGGGATAAGANAGAGGAGTANSYRTNSAVTYAGGGGGGGDSSNGAGGAGGGGAGGNGAGASVAGTVNTGGGGGAGGNAGNGSSGGSGIVVIRYAI